MNPHDQTVTGEQTPACENYGQYLDRLQLDDTRENWEAFLAAGLRAAAPVTGGGAAPRIVRTPWKPLHAHATTAVWNGLPVLISRVFNCDRPTNHWNAYVAGAQVGRWGMPMKTAVQSIAKSIREIRAISIVGK